MQTSRNRHKVQRVRRDGSVDIRQNQSALYPDLAPHWIFEVRKLTVDIIALKHVALVCCLSTDYSYTTRDSYLTDYTERTVKTRLAGQSCAAAGWNIGSERTVAVLGPYRLRAVYRYRSARRSSLSSTDGCVYVADARVLHWRLTDQSPCRA